MIEMTPCFSVRGTVPDDLVPGQQLRPPSVNGRGDLMVAQGLPPLTELSRLGFSFMCMQSSAVTPLAAIPTTTAAISLYNAEPVTGKCYVIDSVVCGSTATMGGGTAGNLGLMGMINPAGTNPTNGLTPFSLSGRPSYRGSAKIGLAVTVTNNGWFALGNSTCWTATTNNQMTTFEFDCKGLYVIPPGSAFNIAIVAMAATATSCIAGIRWHEIQLQLG